MSSLTHFDGKSDGNIMGYFGSTLTRSWYMADGPPSHFNLGDQYRWLSLLLSDQNRTRAARLHTAYYQCRSQITNDKFALETLEQQYYKMQCRVTPIYRLPAEIMMEIFHIALDVGQLRGGLMQVCWFWCNTVEGMASVWSSLDLRAETTPERVQHVLGRAGTHPLAMRIDVDKARSTAERLQPSLAMAGSKASQWQTLIIASLPQDESVAQSNHALSSIQLQPMKQLRHLRITEPVLSPLLRSLLQNVATTAVGKLISMETHSFPAVQYLLQPTYSSIYGSLTTFIAKVPKMNRPVDLLPHFMQLEVLELTNLLLLIVVNGSPLPLAHTLHRLYLKSVSIQWMGGRVFSQLENCTVISPLTDPSPRHDVQLPACTALHFENWNISPIGQFFAPELDHLIIDSNAWSSYAGNEQVIRLVRAGFGMGLQPKSLSLSVTCTGKVLLAVLQLLPGLVELRLDLPRPSALGKHFFTGLLAKPGKQLADKSRFDWRELFRENVREWRCTVCPSLRVLELKYHKWLRRGDNDDFLPPLLALSWSREKTTTPLQCDVHYKTSAHSWESLGLPVPQALSCFRMTQDGQVNQLSLEMQIFSSAAVENLCITPFFPRLQLLRLLRMTSFSSPGMQVLDVLPFFHELRDLELSGFHIPPLDVDLPLVHTLRRLSLKYSTLAWMDGLVFTKLQNFLVDEHGWPEMFKRNVGMPACTHIVFRQDKLMTLPILQSNFYFPLLATYILPEPWSSHKYDKRGISALRRIHADVFGFCIYPDDLRPLELLESKDEVEQLNLVILPIHSYTSTYLGVLTRFSVAHPITSKLPCPNMKVLRFQVTGDTDREEIIQSCIWMMNNRRLTGHSLEKCYIWWYDNWWDHNDWETAASLVLVMENETVRIEG